jgi:5'-3' exoribonuclease 1
VLSKSQRGIFEKIKAFVMENRNAPSPSHHRAARLAMPNDFPARDKQFITKLSDDLHLSVQWDEYDEQDVNLVTWRFPHAVDDGVVEEGVVEDSGENSEEWESEDDAEAKAAVDRVLKKYEKAQVEDLDAQGSFDERYAASVKEKMDEWKRGYYQVRK